MWPGSGRATQKQWPTGQISGRALARPSPIFYPEENFSDKIPTTETILTPVHNVLFSFIGLISKTFELNKCTSEAKFVVIYVAGGTFEMPN